MTGSRTIADRPSVVPLDDALQPAVLGAKAANLARARAGGLPVIDGFVIPPGLAAGLLATPRGARTDEVEVVRAAWGTLSRRGSDPVVVRSSSVAEDTERSSQAGVFESVVDVHGWDDFLDAVRSVVASGTRIGPTHDPAPLAVLVQRHIDPERSGVLFTADPVSGRTDRLVAAVVDGGPQLLVSGAESGTRLVLDRRGRVVEGRRPHPLRRGERAALVRLARYAEAIFGAPQDIEWAIGADGRPVLLQSRPITTLGRVAVDGPTFGPGPLAETFPDPLRRLEQDLWLTPLRDALRVVLRLTGGATSRAIDRSPVVITVGGRPAVDLDLLDGARSRGRGLALLDPRPRLRRLRVAWQVGRLRSGLPSLAGDLIGRLERELGAVPRLDLLDDDALVLLLERSVARLRAAHGYELLAGTLAAEHGPTGAEVALGALAAGRRANAADAEIVAAHPSVLALTPPAISPTVTLPRSAPGADDAALPAAALVAELGTREALRLRVRWLHELTARAAWTLGQRLTAAGRLPEPGAIADLDLTSLMRVVRSRAVIAPLPAPPTGPPLPARFRLAADGSPVAALDASQPGDGVAAGGGRGTGIVEHGPDPSPGSVLVVASLDPRLAAVLPGLAGLVAATGSPLSHLAILAREHGVPTVVGVADAADRFPPGTEVLVDGTTGEVRVLASARGSGAPG